MSSFEHIYDALQLYKEDPVFLMAVPDAKEMLDVLEKSDDLFEKKYFLALSNEWYAFSFLIDEFEEHREDVKWYYENKGTYLRERLIYEYIDPKSEDYLSDSIKEDYFSFFNREYYDQEMDDVLNVYNKCVAGGYGQALYFMYYEDYLYTLTNEIPTDEDLCIDEEYPVKYAMTYFTKWIDKRYDSYEKIARESRDIFKELEQSISILSECSKDKFFLKEVPNTFDIIDNMKKAMISNNEDEAYSAFCQLYDIRYTINLHKKYPEDMKFFYENRDISKLIELKDKDINFSYIEHLYSYLTIFETSLTLTRCWSRLSGSSTLMEDKFLSINISIGPDNSSMEDFIKWVVNKINETTKYYKWRKKNMKPNIFNYATGELTNDAMICWMLDWANSNDERYKNLSQDILRLFTGNKYLFVDFINIKKQYKNIDILVEVNDSEVIVIEDKVYTSHHSSQLEKYKEIIENSEEYKNYNKHYIYYKIGNECPYNGVEQAKYKRISRDAILNVIKRYRYLGNNLLNDYIDYLEDMETTFNMYKSEDDINKWYWQTWEGYYNHLQVQKNIENVCWYFVSNPKGGFLGFFWNHKELKYIKEDKEIDYLLYLQIESNSGNSDGDKTKLAFKLKCEDSDYRKEIRSFIYDRLKELLRKYISIDNIRKPKFKDGLHMTIAEIKNINTRTKLDEVIKLSEKCIDKIKIDV